MNQSYRNFGNNKGSFGAGKPNPVTAKPKIIYAEDELFAGKTENGYYLFHTTLDPSETYKQRRIGNLTERPAKEFIVEKVVYGQMADKIKWKLDKEKLQEWIEEEYKYIFSNKPSPWAPKKLGVKRAPSETEQSDSDSDTEPDEPSKKKVKITADEVTNEILKKLEDCYTLLLETTNHLRQQQNKPNPQPDDS